MTGAMMLFLQAIPIFLINKGTAAMHPEILAFCEQPGLLFSDELPDDDEVGDKVKTAKAQFTASF